MLQESISQEKNTLNTGQDVEVAKSENDNASQNLLDHTAIKDTSIFPALIDNENNNLQSSGNVICSQDIFNNDGISLRQNLNKSYQTTITPTHKSKEGGVSVVEIDISNQKQSSDNKTDDELSKSKTSTSQEKCFAENTQIYYEPQKELKDDENSLLLSLHGTSEDSGN